MLKWTDATSYSQGRERVQTAWETRAASARIYVTTGHIYLKGRWAMHCHPWFDTHDMGPDTLPVAEVQAAAIIMVRDKVSAIHNAIIAALAA